MYGQDSLPLHRILVVAMTLSICVELSLLGHGVAQPKCQMIMAIDSSFAPTFYDPAETPAMGTPYAFLYTLHDAPIKPLPGNAMTPCLAESWTEAADGLSIGFKLRQGLKSYNGDSLLHAVGPRVIEPAIGITPLTYFPTRYEDMRVQE
jgi:ABC-type transport system substrate-binding protein